MKRNLIFFIVFLGIFGLLFGTALACGNGDDGEDCDEVNTGGYVWINTDQYQDWFNETLGNNGAITDGEGIQNIEAYGLGNDITIVEFEGGITEYDLYDLTTQTPLGEINHAGEALMGTYVNAASSPDCPEINASVTNRRDFSTSNEMTENSMQSSACADASLDLNITGDPGTVKYDVINEQVHNYLAIREDGAYQGGFTRTSISASNLTP